LRGGAGRVGEGGSHKRCACGPDFVTRHPERPLRRLRVRPNMLNRINVIWAVQSPLQKYFASPVGQIISTSSRHPTPPEGRIAIVTDAGRDAVDAAAFCARWDRRAGSQEFVSDHRHADERCCCGRQNRVVLTPRRWRQVLRMASRPYRVRTSLISRDDGGKRARSPGRARHKLLKPLRAGMPGVPVYSLLLVCVLPIQTAHEAAGATGTRHSPRPPGGERFINDSGALRCEGVKLRLKAFWLFEN
jgi:hypothetical protein